MTFASYWWTSKALSGGASGSPPQLINPGDRDIVEDELVNETIWNLGGPASTWTIGDLPTGVYAVTYSNRVELKGAYGQPDLTPVANIEFYIGEVIDLYVVNAAGGADDWTVDTLPNGLSVTSEQKGRIRIQGTITN